MEILHQSSWSRSSALIKVRAARWEAPRDSMGQGDEKLKENA